MTTPFSDLAPYHFHSRTVRGVHRSRFDPIVKTRFVIEEDAKIMTMGSCFAQHVSKWLLDNGYKILLREQESHSGGGMFSANYGNVYTVAQALQLFDRVFGNWSPNDELYEKAGCYFDPLRPSVKPDGWTSSSAALKDRYDHEEVVKDLFLEANVIVFTLGLTEAFIRTDDGAVLPTAPGVIAGDYDELRYKFKNFSYDEVLEDLRLLINRLIEVNSGIRIVLTVSPVPLAATYEERHVSVSSMASKAKLRAVVEEVLAEFGNVDYFPSFEIFMTPGLGGSYFESDARSVMPVGVSHAMRLFEKHFTRRSYQAKRDLVDQYSRRLLALYENVVCDEEKLDEQL
ncbi:MAG: GSCFA domain-containing protein [Pseudomonadales bacterium]|nr:GSCFA domain-containing protein [Pseudomonadales bacterium]